MKVKITLFGTIWTLCFLLYYLPEYYVLGSTLTAIRNLAYGIVFFEMIILKIGIYYKRKIGTRKSSILLMCLFLWALPVSSIVNFLLGNDVNLRDAMLHFVASMGLILLCDIGFSVSEKKTLERIIAVGIFMCSLNAISFFVYYGKGGMNPGSSISIYGNRINREVFFLLGRDNATFFHSWPIIVACWYYYIKYKGNLIQLCIFSTFSVLVVVSYFYTWSAMAAFVLLAECVLAYYFTITNRRERLGRDRWWNDFNKLWIVALCFNILLSAQIILPYLVPVVNSIFRKSSTLTRRTFIWEKSYQYILNSPWIGYGTEGDWTIMDKLGINHTHNMFLETLYRGGVIGLAITIYYFYTLSKEVEYVSNNGSAAQKYLLLSVFMFLISSSVEFAYYRYHFVIIFLLVGQFQNTEIKRR